MTDVVVWKRPGCEFVYKLQPGDTWTPHPAGGIIVANPERKPLWCHFVDGAYVQEWLEAAGEYFVGVLDMPSDGQVVDLGEPVERGAIGMVWSPHGPKTED